MIIKLLPHAYFTLVKKGEGEIDCGYLCESVDESGETLAVNELRIGARLKVGSPIPRSYSPDCWLTTPIEKIVSKSKRRFGF